MARFTVGQSGYKATKCYKCEKEFVHNGCFAEMIHDKTDSTKDCMNFFTPTTQEGDKLYLRYHQTGPNQNFKNMSNDSEGKSLETKPVCYQCVGERLHKEKGHYVEKRGEGDKAYLKLSSDWHHISKNYRFPRSEKAEARAAERACKHLAETENKRAAKDPTSNHIDVDAFTVYKEMHANVDIQQGQDWVNILCPDLYLCYAHCECDVFNFKSMQNHNPSFIKEVEEIEARNGTPGIVSAQSCSWWRLHTPKLAKEAYGQTAAGGTRGGR